MATKFSIEHMHQWSFYLRLDSQVYWWHGICLADLLATYWGQEYSTGWDAICPLPCSDMLLRVFIEVSVEVSVEAGLMHITSHITQCSTACQGIGPCCRRAGSLAKFL